MTMRIPPTLTRRTAHPSSMVQVGFAGAFVNPKSLGQVEYVRHGLCMVDVEQGSIAAFEEFENAGELEARLARCGNMPVKKA